MEVFVFFVYGGTETSDRERIRAINEKLDNTIIVASYGTFSTGINIRNLHNIIFGGDDDDPYKNITIYRSWVEDLAEQKQCMEDSHYDIADDLSIE